MTLDVKWETQLDRLLDLVMVGKLDGLTVLMLEGYLAGLMVGGKGERSESKMASEKERMSAECLGTYLGMMTGQCTAAM